MNRPHAACCLSRANLSLDWDPRYGKYARCLICGHHEFEGMRLREPTAEEKGGSNEN